MTVRELNEKLEHAPDDAEVILYDGLDKGDVFCEKVEVTTAKEYNHYCADNSYTENLDGETKLCVLLGY